MLHKRTRLAWRNMLSRCLNPKDKAFVRYSGRGIGVCKRWMMFENFVADMGHAPDGLTLDRINNDGNYEPGNCRWATPKEQVRNTSANRRYTFRGETRLLVEWSETLGIGMTTINERIKRGWSVDEALSHRQRPPKNVRRHGQGIPRSLPEKRP